MFLQLDILRETMLVGRDWTTSSLTHALAKSGKRTSEINKKKKAKIRDWCSRICVGVMRMPETEIERANGSGKPADACRSDCPRAPYIRGPKHTERERERPSTGAREKEESK